MAMGIVETLEMIHVRHGQHVLPAEALQSLVQRTPPRQTGQLVAKGHEIGFVSDGHDQHEQHVAAEDVQCGDATERLRQHQQQGDQRDDLRRM